MHLSPPARVVWIEIPKQAPMAQKCASRHPRGWCGLKCLRLRNFLYSVGRHPRGWCGLKWVLACAGRPRPRRHPRGWCGLKLLVVDHHIGAVGRHPRGWCGLKFSITELSSRFSAGRHPRGWCGLKFIEGLHQIERLLVATREGGVD